MELDGEFGWGGCTAVKEILLCEFVGYFIIYYIIVFQGERL